MVEKSILLSPIPILKTLDIIPVEENNITITIKTTKANSISCSDFKYQRSLPNRPVEEMWIVYIMHTSIYITNYN